MQNFIKTIISGLKLWTKKEIKKSSPVSDWNQNDSSANDYIKNKPDVALASQVVDFTNEVREALGVISSDVNNAQTTADGKMDATNPVGTGSFSMNRKAGSTVGDYSHAEGNNTTASGDYSHAAGYGTVASGENSHAEGRYTKASGTYSHAEGLWTTSPNNSTHVQGEYNYTPAVLGLYYSLGNRQLNGNSDTVSTYSMAVDIDQETGKISYRDPQEALFTSVPPKAYVIPDDDGHRVWRTKSYAQRKTDGGYYISCAEYIAKLNEGRGLYAHVVGNGISDTDRSNAHTLDWDGNAWFAGDVYVGSTSGTNKDSGSVKLATMNDIAIITLEEIDEICIIPLEAGVYQNGVLTISWDDLVSNGYILVDLIGEGSVASSENAANLEGEIVFPDSVSYILFMTLPNITKVVMSDSIVQIDPSSFDGCEKLTEIVFSKNLTTIEGGMFRGCNSLVEVTIPETVSTVGNYTFDSCTNLTKVVFSDGVTSIGESVFNGCSKLSSVTIPHTLTKLVGFTFSNCPLTSINFSGTISQWNALEKASDWSTYSALTQVVCSDGTITL